MRMTKQFYSVLFSFGLFLTLNAPSVKIFYSSEMINIFAFLIVWIVGVIRILQNNKRVIKFYRYKIEISCIYMFMWFIIFIVTLIKSPVNMNFIYYIQYLVVILFFIGVLFFTQKEDIPKVLYLQILWGMLLSILKLTIGIDLKTSLGQHYLTLGMPIGAGIVSGISIIVYKNKRINLNIFVMFALIISIYGITSLRGRAPILLSFLVSVLIALISLFYEKNIRVKIKKSILHLFILSTFGWLLYNNLSNTWFNRFYRLMNFKESEPRYWIYSISLDIIKNNPLGIGLKNYASYGIGYPHNIFLEIFISGGIGSFVVFLFIVILAIKIGLKSIKKRSYAICAFSIFLFYFLTWNISFDLSSSYIPFASMAIMIVSIINKENDSNKSNRTIMCQDKKCKSKFLYMKNFGSTP